MYDRATKAALYAKAGIDEYWIVNLRDNQVEVHRQPQPTAQGFEATYMDVSVLLSTDTVTLQAAPAASILIADLLP
jgi:Uma2 family endonuclease